MSNDFGGYIKSISHDDFIKLFDSFDTGLVYIGGDWCFHCNNVIDIVVEEAKKQTRWSIGAVVVAVITMFVTIGFQVYCTQSVLVEDVKPSVIQTVKKEVLPKPAVGQKDVPVVEKPKKDGAKTTSDNGVKNKGKKSQQ